MTPMQEQYNRIKEESAGAVVLFRMGDFYETFNEDAVIVSKILGITLTGRGKNETRTPMAGIPYHALPNYLPKLIEAELKIAIADQMEEPQPGKLVERRVTKLITPGTILDENSLDASRNNYIASIYKDGQIISLVYCDLSTAELVSFESDSQNQIKMELGKIAPREVVLLDSQKSLFENIINSRIEVIPEKESNLKLNYKILVDQFETTNLKGFGIEEKSSTIISAGLLIQYLKECQKTELNHIKSIKTYNYSDFMRLDFETIRNLELLYSMDGSNESTLFNILNECQTSMGKRKLRNWIVNPLINADIISDRIECVDYFFCNPMITSELREYLKNVIDIERVAGKIGVGSANPKDLYALCLSLDYILNLFKSLDSADGEIPTRLKHLINSAKELKDNLDKNVISLIKNGIKEDPPGVITDGGIIKDGFNNEVDELREIRKNSKAILAKMQADEVQKTGITSLKISFNNVFGYYIEVTKTHLDKVPSNYIRKQTLANAERYITEDLKVIEEKILTSQEKLIKIESTLYKDILEKLIPSIQDLLNLAQIISELDVISNFGYISRKYQYCKPELSKDEEEILEIKNGRHPVVERLLKEFTPNSSTFNNKQKIHILTGPNMSGKSTYIRQTALITLMAQIGCFAPADEMRFSIINRIFTRVGASDNLSRGESTFMVEMNETANILNNADEKSLIILDEVGRGTSTYDGVAIAWSLIEYIAKNLKCKTLFATHYHELTELEGKLDGVKNFNVEVLEENGEIMFKHKIISGGASKSYGVHVAKLAGVPKEVIDRADEILKNFEGEEKSKPKASKTTGSGGKKSPTTPKKMHPSQLGLI